MTSFSYSSDRNESTVVSTIFHYVHGPCPAISRSRSSMTNEINQSGMVVERQSNEADPLILQDTNAKSPSTLTSITAAVQTSDNEQQQSESSTPTANPALGYTLMVASSVCHAVMTFFVHLAEVKSGLPPPSALVIRACTSLTLSSTYILLNRPAIRAVQWTRRKAILLALRGLAGGPSAWLSFEALARLPVGTAMTIFYASPALTAITSSLLLRDHPLTLALMLTIAANFTGIALVSDPTTQGTHLAGVLCALGMAIMSTTVFVLQRAMGLGVHFVLGVFAYSWGCAFIAACVARSEDISEVFTNRQGVLFALCSGIAGFGSQSFLNRGLQHAPAGPAIVVRSLNVPLTFVLGLVFLGERPSLMSLAGVVIVLGSVVAIGFQKLRSRQG